MIKFTDPQIQYDLQMPEYKEPEKVCHCTSCYNDIYEGDDMYIIDDEPYCENCVKKTVCEKTEFMF